MLEDLIEMHQEVMKTTPMSIKRYCYPLINWKSNGICILGDRGTGKTTMICQYCLETYQTPDRGLYLSADHINVISYGLFNIAKSYFSEGGEALFIDEVHKYPEWSTEIKSILDVYKGRQIVFSASSSIDLNKSKADLSRRVVYHRLLGLSFREYLLLNVTQEFPILTFQEILDNHVKIASKFKSISILKHFKEYLRYGYYPFFLEGIEDYLSKLNNVIEKVLFEDIAVIYNLKQTSLPVLKKLLWLVATSKGLVPNIDRISKDLRISREMVYNCLEYLKSSGLINDVYPTGKGMKLVRKPGKIYLNNTNLDHAIHGSLKLDAEVGGIRETFFVNQVGSKHKVDLHEKGDFLIDDQIIIEVGGKGKTTKQIRDIDHSYLAVDNIEIGFGKKIPLYLFGFLY
jgi:uncharacterized protein